MLQSVEAQRCCYGGAACTRVTPVRGVTLAAYHSSVQCVHCWATLHTQSCLRRILALQLHLWLGAAEAAHHINPQHTKPFLGHSAPDGQRCWHRPPHLSRPIEVTDQQQRRPIGVRYLERCPLPVPSSISIRVGERGQAMCMTALLSRQQLLQKPRLHTLCKL